MESAQLKTAFITGISGQDGAYLSKLLLEKGYSVIGITRNNHSDSFEKLKRLEIDEHIVMEECDLLDLSSIITLINKYKPT